MCRIYFCRLYFKLNEFSLVSFSEKTIYQTCPLAKGNFSNLFCLLRLACASFSLVNLGTCVCVFFFFPNLHCIFISLVNSALLKLNENNEIECIQGFCYCLFSYNLVFVSRIPYLVSGPTHFHFTQDVFVYLLDVWIHKPFFYLFSMIAKLLVLTVIEKNTQDNIGVVFFFLFGASSHRTK